MTKPDDTVGDCLPQDCSLREAIAAANPGDTVQIPAGTYTLSLSLGQLDISKDLTLDGAGLGDTMIEATTQPNVANFRVINIRSGGVTISGVTIRHGDAPDNAPGGIRNQGMLTLIESSVTNNRAAVGSGIWSSTNLTIIEPVP